LSDDDPAGVTTYSVLGASFGYKLLWTIPLSTALLICFHLLGVRLGIATGRGFTALVRERYGARAGRLVAGGFVLANFGTICAEFAGVAAACTLAGLPPQVSAPLAAVVVTTLVIAASFHRVEHVLLVVSGLLASYLGSALLAHPDWHAVARGSLIPNIPDGQATLIAITATVGTTLAPWGLSFIQSYAVDKGLTLHDWRVERVDTIVGAVLTGLIGMAIAITCAAVLHPAGIDVRNAGDAARALTPLAGEHAKALFGAGLLGASLLAAAIVPLATAYSMAEGLGRRGDLDDPAGADHLFYGTIVVTVVAATAVVSIPGLPLLRLIYLSQLVNAVFLPPQLVLLLRLSRDPTVVGGDRIGKGTFAVGVAGIVIVVICLCGLVWSSR
jgi:Mn2+/Fe2+ NRAMP family transporter